MNIIMSREDIVTLGRQLYGLETFNTYTANLLLREYCEEKGKDIDKINILIALLKQLPINFTISYYKTLYKYYSNKFNVYELYHNNKLILIY